ncbi:MAG: class I tRNA ligase family protein, partial [Myxococcales bacterium]|nr:class I tRNA ligase family protein [Myxococcales bacterium]
PWSATRHALSNVRALQKEFAVKLRNVYSFFTIYANLDGFRPGERRPLEGLERVERVDGLERAQRPELDRWILSELALAVREVTARMDDYDVFQATGRLVKLVDALSNWWVRRSRARFWRSAWDDDKRSAHETLHAVLVTIAKLTAPFTPYAAEAMYQNLVVRPGLPGARESVHLEDWPAVDPGRIDERLSRKIEVAREIVSLGLRARMDAQVKVRQPLRRATVVLHDDRDADLAASALEAIREELNVLEVVLGTREGRRAFGRTQYKPNFRTLGKRGLGKVAQELKAALAREDAEAVGLAEAALAKGRAMWRAEHEILAEDIEVGFEPAAGVAAAADRLGSVFLDTQLDDELRDLGLVRELLNRLQTLRKEMGLDYADRIAVWIAGSERVRRIVEKHRDSLASEVLAVALHAAAPPAGAAAVERSVEVEGEAVVLAVVAR